MADQFRAMCAELVDAIFTPNPYNWEDSLYEAANRARALLDQPEPPELTRDELLRCAKIATPDCSNHWGRELEMMRAAITADRALLAKWGHQ